MNFFNSANISKYLGGALFVIGIYFNITPLWIVGLNMTVIGIAQRIFQKIKKSRNVNQEFYHNS